MMVLFTGVMLRGFTLANIDGSNPSRPIANRMRVCPYIVTRVTEKIEITAPAARIVLAQVESSVMFVEDDRQPGLAGPRPNFSHGWAPRAANATRMYMVVTIEQRGDDGPRHGLLRIFDLVTRGGHGVEADEGEEDGAGSRGDGGDAHRREVRRTDQSVNAVNAMAMNIPRTPSLMITMTVLTFADS